MQGYNLSLLTPVVCLGLLVGGGPSEEPWDSGSLPCLCWTVLGLLHLCPSFLVVALNLVVALRTHIKLINNNSLVTLTCLFAKSYLTLSWPHGLVAHQAPLSVGFPRQEYWSELPFSFPGNLPDPEIESESPAWQTDSLPLSHLGSPVLTWTSDKLQLSRCTGVIDLWHKSRLCIYPLNYIVLSLIHYSKLSLRP